MDDVCKHGKIVRFGYPVRLSVISQFIAGFLAHHALLYPFLAAPLGFPKNYGSLDLGAHGPKKGLRSFALFVKMYIMGSKTKAPQTRLFVVLISHKILYRITSQR